MRGALKALDDELHKREGKGTAISLHLRAQKETPKLSANSDRQHQDGGTEQEPRGSKQNPGSDSGSTSKNQT